MNENRSLNQCMECQDVVRNATSEIYVRLRDAQRAGMIHEQTLAVVMVLLRKIEQQVASKEER
jgi:hypothetical protein